MNREAFYAELLAHDEAGLRKVLWTLYWRGPAAVRQRIEAELDPQKGARPRRVTKEPVDPEQVAKEVGEFIALARSGAYLGRDRRVSPKERSRWRFTFKRLAGEAQDALVADSAVDGSAALTQLIDFACEIGGYDYFRSQDPIEAAKFVVSDAVALLWRRTLDLHGVAGFSERAAPQLIRWESRYGWTRSGFGQVSEREESLANMLAPMLRIPDAWIVFTDHYLDALDQVEAKAGPDRVRRSGDRGRGERTEALAEWNLLLVDRLAGSDAEDRLDGLAGHPALGGPELKLLQARLAHRRGDDSGARSLVHECLEKRPGHQGFLDFATGIGAPLPSHSQEILNRRRG